MKQLVIFTGAGISAESGIKTFRDSDGLWENYNIADVATPEAWERDADLVLDFYNQRRKQVFEASPNDGHLALVELEKKFKVHVITQNIDDLHERAGSKNVLHLHGEITKARSESDHRLVYPLAHWEMKPGMKNEEGHRLRPHIVWFGEAVPAMDTAIFLTMKADIFIVIGSSLEVYPAASLINYAPEHSQQYLIDPHYKPAFEKERLTVITDKAGKAVPQLVHQLLQNHV